jgi:hypothetical protein
MDDAQTHLDPCYACFELVLGLSYMPISSSKHMCITGPSVCMGSTKMCLGVTSHIWGGQKGSQGKINHSILLYYLQWQVCWVVTWANHCDVKTQQKISSIVKSPDGILRVQEAMHSKNQMLPEFHFFQTHGLLFFIFFPMIVTRKKIDFFMPNALRW